MATIRSTMQDANALARAILTGADFKSNGALHAYAGVDGAYTINSYARVLYRRGKGERDFTFSPGRGSLTTSRHIGVARLAIHLAGCGRDDQ